MSKANKQKSEERRRKRERARRQSAQDKVEQRLDAIYEQPLPKSSLDIDRDKASMDELQEAYVAAVTSNPLYVGMGPFRERVLTQTWVHAAAARIGQIGAEQFLVDLLAAMRRSFAGFARRSRENADTRKDMVTWMLGRYGAEVEIDVNDILQDEREFVVKEFVQEALKEIREDDETEFVDWHEKQALRDLLRDVDGRRDTIRNHLTDIVEGESQDDQSAEGGQATDPAGDASRDDSDQRCGAEAAVGVRQEPVGSGLLPSGEADGTNSSGAGG